jgi:RNA polymerase sigma-70 factor (sigma-E family)
MDADAAAADPLPQAALAGPGPIGAGAEAAVSELYRSNALGLVRLAHIMLGSRELAEDVVQDAFYGLYRRWGQLNDPAKALRYVRSSVLNGCRSALRRRSRPEALGPPPEPVASAEAAALAEHERREVIGALRQLPARQREALVLRYYLGLSPAEIALVMGIGEGSVRSATHRGLAALGRILGEDA